MTPNEMERLARLEERVAHTGADIAEIKATVAELRGALLMGRGAMQAAIRMGALLLLAAGAVGWLVEHAQAWLGRP